MTKDQIEARMKRMASPWNTRKGYIKCGYMIRKCYNCNKVLSGMDESCHSCGSNNLGHPYPTKSNYYVFYSDNGAGDKAFGLRPDSIECAFIKPPHESIKIGRECYRGSRSFCRNYHNIDSHGNTSDNGLANRQGVTGNIKCDPLSCPFTVGGEYDGKKIKPDQCGETVTMFLWLPKVEGLNCYQFKSGSINTINHIQDFLPKYYGLMKTIGGFYPVRLVLSLEKIHTARPDGKGGFVPVKDAYASKLDINFSIEDMMDKANNNQLNPYDVAYQLPSPTDRLQLPEPDYDDLIDGSRQPREPESGNVIPLDNLESVDNVTEPEKEMAKKSDVGYIKKLFNDYTGNKTDHQKKKFKRELIQRFNLPTTNTGDTRLDGLHREKAMDLINYLEDVIQQDKVDKEHKKEEFENLDFSHIHIDKEAGDNG